MNTQHAEPAGMKQKVAHELRLLLLIFVYLAVFFLVLRTYTRLVMAQYQVIYLVYGLTLLKALALAKVVLTGETLRLGERFRARPLIVVTLYKTVVFTALALAFEVLEHLILGWAHGKATAEVVAELLEKGWPHIAAATLVVFVALLPVIAFREMERALGEGTFHRLFLKQGPRAEPEPDGKAEDRAGSVRT
jgi:hypothetical protein